VWQLQRASTHWSCSDFIGKQAHAVNLQRPGIYGKLISQILTNFSQRSALNRMELQVGWSAYPKEWKSVEAHAALQPLLQIEKVAPGRHGGQLYGKGQGGGVQNHLHNNL